MRQEDSLTERDYFEEILDTVRRNSEEKNSTANKKP